MSNIRTEEKEKYLKMFEDMENNIINYFKIKLLNDINSVFENQPWYSFPSKRSFEETFQYLINIRSDYYRFRINHRDEFYSTKTELHQIQNLFKYCEHKDVVELSKKDLNFIDRWLNINLIKPNNFEEYEELLNKHNPDAFRIRFGSEYVSCVNCNGKGYLYNFLIGSYECKCCKGNRYTRKDTCHHI